MTSPRSAAAPNPSAGGRLAADGGTPVRRKFFPAWPQPDASARAALLDVFDSGHWWQADWSTGRVEELEAELARRFGTANCVAVMNGTAALEVAFATLGLGPGDEVLVPATTFISTATAVSATGATPVPVDVERGTLHLDLASAAAAIGPATRAIAPVHLGGALVDLASLAELAQRRGCAVVEDAAQVYGARRGGLGAGAVGQLTVLSFQAGKLVPAGEGGAVLIRDAARHEEVFALTHCGTQPGSPWYRHERIGSNRRLTEFQAALVLSQLDAAPAFARRRAQAASWLSTQLQARGIKVMETTSDPGTEDPSMFWFWLPESVRPQADARTFAQLLSEEGIPAAPMYPTWHRTPAYAGTGAARVEAPVAQEAEQFTVWLHHRMLLGEPDDLTDIVAGIDKVVEALTTRAPHEAIE